MMKLLGLLTVSLVLSPIAGGLGVVAAGEKATDKKKEAPKDTPKKAAKAKEKEEESKTSKSDLEAWGVIKEMKGTDFWNFTYTKVEGRKATRPTVFIKVASEPTFYQDKAIQLTALKEGEKVWLLGRPVEREAPSASGMLGMDRQMQNVSAVVVGDFLQPNTSYKDPRDPKVQWLEAEVSEAGQAIKVKYEGAEYKVVMSKSFVAVRREKCAEAKALKGNMSVQIAGDKSTERPETKSSADAKKESFLVKSVVILDPRVLKTLYPILLE
jgi:hypothetical protein